MPLGNVVVVMVNTGLTVMLNNWFFVCGGVPESVAPTVKLVVPAVAGVPERVPEALRCSPEGSDEPDARVQLMVPVPPLLLNPAL